MTDAPSPPPLRFRAGGLSQRKSTRFAWSPDAETRRALAKDLGLLALHHLDFSGQIDPKGRGEFRLYGHLTARVDQACVVTLTPVPAELDEPVLRRYVADLPAPQGEEAEMPEDDSLEPLPDTLDIPAIGVEALMLALPLYPRAEGAMFSGQNLSAEGDSAGAEVQAKPFAGLAGLAERLQPGGKDDDQE